MSVAIRNSFEILFFSLKKHCYHILYIKVNASTFITVKKTKELIYKNSSDSGREKKTVEVLQLLLAQLSAWTLFIKASKSIPVSQACEAKIYLCHSFICLSVYSVCSSRL